MRMEITDEAGHLMLDGDLLPGLFEGLEIEGALDIDDQQVPGASEASRQVQGFKPATVIFKLLLPTDDESTCFEKLAVLTRRFRATDDRAEPFIRRIINEQTTSWGIDQVLFVTMRSVDDGKADSVKAELRFEEWKPATRRKEAAVGSPPLALDPALQALLGYGSGTAYSSHPSEVTREQLMTDVAPAPW
ncbi:MAG: hypothetical protein ACOY94_19570 [Bacillota bacterium]